MKRLTPYIAILVAIFSLGCGGNIETTDDSVRTEVEIPKVETGEEPLDLDPTTDDDLDLDTPMPGDR